VRNGLAGPVRAHCDSLPAQGSLTAGATVPFHGSWRILASAGETSFRSGGPTTFNLTTVYEWQLIAD
jgi:hypothetical protein